MDKIDSSKLNLSEYKENYIEKGSTREDGKATQKIFKNIVFSENISFDDKKILSKINNEEFKSLAFKNCEFKNIEILNCQYALKFVNCSLENMLLKHSFNGMILEDCTIGDLFFVSCQISDANKNYNNMQIVDGKINKFEIKNSSIPMNIHINHDSNKRLEIANLNITNSIFEKDFSFHNSIIENIKINNCDFNSLSEFNECEFKKKFDLSEVTYEGLTLFDDCVFSAKAEFKYIIFEKLISFRGSKFFTGLNLDYTSCEKEMNFFSAKELDTDNSKQETSQETYRIIKHQFEKLGNKIEANKYHALELDQKRRELEKEPTKNWKEYLVFKFHDLSSEHSTNWFRALLWILFIASATSLLNQSFWFLLLAPIAYFVSTKCNDILSFKITVQILFYVIVIVIHPNINIDDIFKFMSIITKQEDFNCNYFLMTVNKVSLGYLYYQFLMSVRKDTRK